MNNVAGLLIEWTPFLKWVVPLTIFLLIFDIVGTILLIRDINRDG